jgi:hypothetical protein
MLVGLLLPLFFFLFPCILSTSSHAASCPCPVSTDRVCLLPIHACNSSTQAARSRERWHEATAELLPREVVRGHILEGAPGCAAKHPHNRNSDLVAGRAVPTRKGGWVGGKDRGRRQGVSSQWTFRAWAIWPSRKIQRVPLDFKTIQSGMLIYQAC